MTAVWGVPRAAGQVQASTCASDVGFGNGSFEQPVLSGNFAILPETSVAPWTTDVIPPQIELWRSGFHGVPAAAGRQFSELAANIAPSTLFQSVATVPGTVLSYALSHRGRAGVDTMELRIGPPGGPPTFTRTISTGTGGWQQVLGQYTVPAGQTMTEFAFRWVSSASSGASGNFLDGVVIGRIDCRLTISKTLSPDTDSGRFDLLVGDQVVLSEAGDGGTAGPLPIPLSTVQVSERAAGGTDLDDYVSAIRCVDQATRELVAQAAGPEVTLSYDRARVVECAVVNERVPAVVLEKVLYPTHSPGRFDLLVDGLVVARSAGNGTVAGPVPVEAGQVTVAERADADTSASAYSSAIECFSGLRRRRAAAFEPGLSVTLPVSPRSLLRCVLVNVARGAPDPVAPPSEPEQSPQAPQAGGDGEIDLTVRAAPERRRVTAGLPGRFRVTVRNRGSVAATGVRLVVSARQGGSRSRAMTLSMQHPTAPCVAARGLGLCYAKRIPAGGSVSVMARASTREQLARLRLLAVADATEPERVVGNNLARARLAVRRRPTRLCPPATPAGPRARAAC